MVQFVDWELAATTAGTLSKSGPKATYEEAAGVVSELRSLTDLADDHVRRFTQLQTRPSHPPVRVVDRPDWSAVNVAGLRQVVGPLMERLATGKEPSALTQAVGSRVTGVQAGTVLAYLSGKVLGQYEVFSSDPGQLLLVAPNIVEVERKLDTAPRDFRLWVCLHEVTHRTQFTAVPWLRAAFLAEVEAFVQATQLDSDQMMERLRRAVDSIAEAIRDPHQSFSVMDLVQTPAQREVLDRLTAMMTLLEGHAEYVMDGVGPEVVPSVDEIRAKFNQRREAANPIERVIRKLLGIDVKLRQYAEGRKFVHTVVDRVGMEAFNEVWSSRKALPRKSELADPDAWISRVLRGRGGAASSTENPGPTATSNPAKVVNPTTKTAKSTKSVKPAATKTTRAAKAAKLATDAAEKPVREAAKKAAKKTSKVAKKAPDSAGGAATSPDAAAPTQRIPPRKTNRQAAKPSDAGAADSADNQPASDSADGESPGGKQG